MRAAKDPIANLPVTRRRNAVVATDIRSFYSEPSAAADLRGRVFGVDHIICAPNYYGARLS